MSSLTSFVIVCYEAWDWYPSRYQALWTHSDYVRQSWRPIDPLILSLEALYLSGSLAVARSGRPASFFLSSDASFFFYASNLVLMIGFISTRFAMVVDLSRAVVDTLVARFVGATRFLFDDVARLCLWFHEVMPAWYGSVARFCADTVNFLAATVVGITATIVARSLSWSQLFLAPRSLPMSRPFGEPRG